MALGDLFASTRNRSPLQTPPLGQFPATSGVGTADGGDGGFGGDGNDFTPNIGEIPQNVQDLLALFGEGDIARLAGSSAEQIAQNFGLGSEFAKFFQPVQTDLLQGAITDIGETRAFGLGQAQDILQLGTTQARQRFGAQAAGLRSGLLGMANLARQRQATSGFAGAGAGQAALGAGRREAQQRLGQAGGAFRTGLTGLQEQFQTTQEGVQTTARGGIRGLLNMIAGQVAGFGGTAADLVAGEAGTTPVEPGLVAWREYQEAGGTLGFQQWFAAGKPGVGEGGGGGADGGGADGGGVFGPGNQSGTFDGQPSSDGNFVWRFNAWIPS